MDYIMITPMYNESTYLQKLKETILNQTVRPALWVIGDGNSTDNSYAIATETFKEYDWIHIIRQKHFYNNGYSHQNISYNTNDCLDYARNTSAEKNIEYAFVGNMDASLYLSNMCFELLKQEMEKDPGLAFTCAQQISQPISINEINNKGPFKIYKGLNNCRLYRKEFIYEIGGYPITFSPDSVLKVKALNRGWRIKKVEKAYTLQRRRPGCKRGCWKGYQLFGNGMYNLGYHPLLLLLNVLYTSISYPYYIGLAIGYGYIQAFIRNDQKITDSEVREYFWNKRLAEIAKGIFWEEDAC